MFLKDQVDKVFEKVIKDVRKGVTITNSLKGTNLSNSYFYQLITEEQRRILESERAVNTKAKNSRGGSGLNTRVLEILLEHQDYINYESI